MDELDTPSILAVGAQLANLLRAKVTGDVSPDQASVTQTTSGREAMRLLRVLPFDVVAVGPELDDMSSRQFAGCLRQYKPGQKWLMVADGQTDESDEVAVRSLGAVAVLEGPDAWKDVVATARRIRKRNPQSTVPGLRLQTVAGGV